MDNMLPVFWVVPALFALVSVAWYVGVIVLLVKIWGKVRHLPDAPGAPRA